MTKTSNVKVNSKRIPLTKISRNANSKTATSNNVS